MYVCAYINLCICTYKIPMSKSFSNFRFGQSRAPIVAKIGLNNLMRLPHESNLKFQDPMLRFKVVVLLRGWSSHCPLSVRLRGDQGPKNIHSGDDGSLSGPPQCGWRALIVFPRIELRECIWRGIWKYPLKRSPGWYLARYCVNGSHIMNWQRTFRGTRTTITDKAA